MNARTDPPTPRTSPGLLAVIATTTLIAASIGLYGSSSAAVPSSPAATITGVVRDHGTHAPVPGAWVCFAELMDGDLDGVQQAVHAFTDSSGAYHVNLPSTQVEWFISASARGYANAGTRRASIPAQLNFDLYAAPDSLQFWGQLTAPSGVSLTGTPVFADIDENDIVSVTDDLGRFAYVVAKDATVPLTIQSTPLGVHRYAVEIDADVPLASPIPVPVHAAIPATPVTARVTYASNGTGAVAGTELRFIGTDSLGVIRFEAAEIMQGSLLHSTAFPVPDGLNLRIVASGQSGWGQTLVTTPVSGQVPLVIENQGTASLAVTLYAEVGLVDMGQLILELSTPATTNAAAVATPVREADVTAGVPVCWSGLPAGTYVLRHRTIQFSRLVDEIELTPGENEGHKYIALAVPTSTPGLGTGTGTISGHIGVPQPASTVIDVYLTDPLDGRIVDHVTANAFGAFSFTSVPAGDWTLHADGVQSNGVEFRQLGGAIDIAVAAGANIALPVVDLTQSIGIAIRAYAIDADSGPEALLTTLDTYMVRLFDVTGEVTEVKANGCNLLAIGDVSPTVNWIEVDAQHFGAQSFAIDLSNVDPQTTFQTFDVIVQ